MNPRESTSSPDGGDSPFPYRARNGDDLFPWPHGLPSDALQISRDGGAYPTAPSGYSETMGRAEYRAKRLGTVVLINAKGTLANTNQIADIRQMPWRIHPPQFGFFVYTPPLVLPAIREFNFSEVFGFPSNETELAIHDADGVHVVKIEDISPKDLPLVPTLSRAEMSSAALGVGKTLQDAFDNAVAQLPVNPNVPDGFVIYSISELGAFRGGFAGVEHCYAKVEVRSGSSPPK